MNGFSGKENYQKHLVLHILLLYFYTILLDSDESVLDIKLEHTQQTPGMLPGISRIYFAALLAALLGGLGGLGR